MAYKCSNQKHIEQLNAQDPYMCCLQETPQIERYTDLKGWNKIFHASGKGKKAGVPVFISGKINFKTKAIGRDEEGPYIMTKGMIQQEDITLVNIYSCNTEAPKYVKQILMHIKGEIERNNTPLTSMDRSSRQKIKKETAALNNTLDQMDLIDIYRAFHPKAAQYTYFSNARGMFSRKDHVLGHKKRSQKI